MKIINEEIDETTFKLSGLKTKLEEEKHRYQDLHDKRDTMQKSWHSDKNLNELHFEVLALMMNESDQIVNNIELDTKN